MTNYVGIDISQAYFDAALMVERQIKAEARFDNDQAGFKQFRNWLSKRQRGPVHIILEATGVYGEAFVEWLYARDDVVSVVNPAQIKTYGQAQLRRAKTDKADTLSTAGQSFCLDLSRGLCLDACHWLPATPCFFGQTASFQCLSARPALGQNASQSS